MNELILPKKCGVMVLPDCTLFPQGGMPLFIFEERYRKMLEDSLAGDCIFAIARVQEVDGEEIISQIGTAGLIRASRESEDGTSELFLHGVMRVKFQQWIDGSPYPCALIEPFLSEEMEERQGKAAVATLKDMVLEAIAGLPHEVKEGVIHMLGQVDDPSLLSDVVAQQFIHEPNLRQTLLETASVGKRISLLCDFFEKLKA
jgi:Lon protease-like protein